MSRPKLTPSWMPWLRSRLAESMAADERRMLHDLKGGSYRAIMSQAWSDADMIRTASMWWVAGDMARLALHTAQYETIPDTPAPQPTGILLVGGGLPDSGAAGLLWMSMPPRGLVVFTLQHGDARPLYAGSPAGDVWRDFLQAVWALSAQPSVTASRDKTPTQHGRSRALHYESPVRVVTLRERPATPSTPGDGTGRTHDHRWMVSGFYRHQHYGRGWAKTRVQWIPPYVAGPAGTPLVVKPEVRVWRRA